MNSANLAPLETLNTLKPSATPTARLYNWNIIKTALDSYGIPLGIDEKSLIIAGDLQIITDLLKSIKSKEEGLKLTSSQVIRKASDTKTRKLLNKQKVILK